MKITHLKWLFLATGMAISLHIWAQDNAMQHYHNPTPPYPVDTWYLVNDGLAPCAVSGGSPNGLYDVATHGDIRVKRWSYRRNEIYAMIDGGNCEGWYRHDTVTNKWIRVADNFTSQYSSTGYVTSNGENIYLLYEGDVYQMIEANEYAIYPNGWKKISVATLTKPQVWSAGCEPSGNEIFGAGLRDGNQQDANPEAIGDTIFVPMLGTCSTERKIGKFSVQSGTWSFLTLSGLPWDLYPSNGTMTFNENFLRYGMKFTFPIAGRFQIFMKIEQARNFGMGNADSTLAIPSFIWAYDYGEPNPALRWKNISEGPDFNNATPSAKPYSSNLMPGFPHRPRPKPGCYNTITKQPLTSPVPPGCSSHVEWEPPTGIFSSFDKKRLYTTTISAVNGGVYWWNGNGWVQVVSDIGAHIRPTNNGIFYKISRYSDNQFYMMDGPLSMQVGQINTFCDTDDGGSGYITPDDGRTWYLNYTSSTQGCGGPTNVGGVYRLIFSSVNKPSATRNLHLNTGTYLGANAADNVPIGVGVGGDYRIYYGGNFNGGITATAPYEEVNLAGASSLSPGKILVMNMKGDSIIRVVNVGNRLDELEVQDVSPFRIAVTGDFGLRVLDSTATNVIWQHNLSGIGLPATGLIHVDISNSGQVVVARQAGAFSGRARVFDGTGTLLTGTLNPGRKFLLDATIKNDTVVLVGENEGAKMNNWCGPCGNFSDVPNGSCPNVTNFNWPIRVPYIFYHAISGGIVDTAHYTKSYDFPSSELQADAADAKINGANFGKDGKLYIVGEHAGTNSVLRWNGKSNFRKHYNETGKCGGPGTPLQQVDGYNSFSVVLNPIVHIGFAGKVEPSTGEIVNGTLVHGLNSQGRAATIKLRKVQTDAKGYIYIGGEAAFQTKGRPLVNINGNLVGNYAGDATYLTLAPNFRTRMFWGPFNATGSRASGYFAGIGIRENIVALAIASTRGTFTTTDNAIVPQAFNSTDSSLNDAYLAAFYQDIWNHAKNDSVKDKLWESDTLINPAQLAWKAEFDVDKRKVCVGDNVTFINKSLGDSLLIWDFGAGASLFPGTQGTGPFSITYSTTGYKTPRLDVLLKNGLSTYSVKHEFIEVLPTTVTLSGEITGPNNVCPGSEAVYSVPATNGITRYNWSFPAGTQILYGEGSPSVRVVFASTGGTVQVTGTYVCGTTAALTKSVTVATKDENKVILVTKEAVPNTVMTFSGSNYFQSSGANVFNGVVGSGATTSFSVELWMRADHTITLPATLVGWGPNNTSEFEIMIDTDSLVRVERGTEMIKYSSSVVDGQWHHIALSVPLNASMGSSNNPTLFIDGVQRTKVASTTSGSSHQNTSANPIRIGTRPYSTSQYFKGLIDDLRVWDTVINVIHVRDYLGTANLSTHPLIGKLRYRVHNDLIGSSTATDYSTHSYTTSAVSGAVWTGDAAYTADSLLKAKLEGKGFNVSMLKAGEISSNGNDAYCGGLVYVSSTVVQATLGEKLKNISVPAIVAQPRTYAPMGMVPSGNANFGWVTAGTQVNVTDISYFSALASNIPATGNRDVYTIGGEIFWGRPNANAISVAQTTSFAGNKTLFGYEAGASLVGGFPAPARRVGFFLNTYDVAKLKPQYGDSLFNRAICWALNNCPASNTITTGTVSPAVYCPGDSITVPFTTTGTFTLSSVPAELPNNVVRLDAGGDGSNTSPEIITSSSAPALATGNNSINNGYIWFNQGAAPASVPASLSWVYNVPYTGVYQIRYHIPNDPNTLNSAATLRIIRPDTSNVDLVFNMQTNKNSWFTLPGTYNFKQGTATLSMRNSGTAGTRIVCDAVELVLVSVANPEGNDFILQLSDKDGSFAGATVLGRLDNSNVTSGSVKGKLPTFLPQGSNYKVRVISTAPAVTGSVTATNITISATAPEAPDPIIGNAFACADATIQGYKVVNPPSLAAGYEWDIPLGASFIGFNDRDSVTVQFNTATTNDIAVRKVGNCGKSGEQTLRVVLSAVAPPQPSAIAGRTVVCNSLTNEVYTVAPVATASSYMWTLPPGATAVGDVTGNSITVNYAGALQGASQITVRAVNPCGESAPTTLNVTIDNAATLPVAGSITGLGELCPNTPNVLYSVAPVAGALGYIWSVSGSGATIDTVTTTFKNQVKLTVGASNVTLSVQVVDACGISAPSVRVINVGPAAEKKALVITDLPIAPTINVGEDSTKARLERLGYTVDFGTSAMPITPSTYCYNMIVLSAGIYDNNNQNNNSMPTSADTTGSGAWNGDDDSKRFKDLPVPMMVSNAYSWNLTGLAQRYRSSGGTNNIDTRIELTNATHPISSPVAPTGKKNIVTSATRYAVAQTSDLPAGATPLATDTVHNNNLIWAIDSGGTIFGPGTTVAPARRVAFFALANTDKDNNNNFANRLTGDGLTMFERSVCWLTNSCDPMNINLTSVSGSTFCAGSSITVQFFVTGAIGAGNKFYVELSNSAGSFTSPVLVDSMLSNTTGLKSITGTLPLSLATGTGYKVRIRATNALTYSNESSTLTINAVPAKVSTITGLTSVCPAQTSVGYKANTVAGATYNWTVPTGASIVNGQGTDTITVNMSGATSGNIAVTTTQGGCTNTDAKTLALTFVSSNNWTGALNSNWHNVGNWSCGYLPTATNDVTISTSPNYPVISSVGAVARNLTVNAGSVTLATGGTLSLTGNLTATAGAFTHTGGTLIFNGTTAQTITRGTALTLENLTINNSAGLTLGASTNTTINGTLTFTAGRLTIGSNNLTFGSAAAITGVSATRYIVVPDNVSATNFVTRQVPTGGTEVLFPIGNSFYSPVTIANNGTTANVQVRSFTGVYENGKTGALLTEKSVNRSWEIVPSTFAANLNIKFQWTSAEQLPLFLTQFAVVRTNPAPGSWNIHTPFVEATGSGVSEMSALGVTGSSKFPMFSIASTNTTLPPILNDVVLMIVGSTTGGALDPTRADTVVHDTLVARGYNVLMLSDLEDEPNDVNSCRFVWISTSASNTKLGTKYRDVVRPVVVNAQYLSSMRLAHSSQGNLGNSNANANVRNTTHPLAMGVTALGAINSSQNFYQVGKNYLHNTSVSNLVAGVAYDSSTNARHASMSYDAGIAVTAFNGFWHTSDPAAGRNTALNFAPVASKRFVILQGYNGPVDTSARSFSAWVKASATDSGTIVSWGRNGTNAGQSLTFYIAGNGRLALGFDHESQNQRILGLAGSPVVNDGNWHHVAFSMPSNVNPSSTSIKLYVDGTPIADANLQRTGTASINLSTNQQNVRIGRNVRQDGTESRNRQFGGLIDDVALWNTALSDADVLNIYNATNGVAAQRWMYPKQANLQYEADFIKIRDVAITPILDRGSMSSVVFAAFEQGLDAVGGPLPGRRVLFPFSAVGYADNDGVRGTATTRQNFKNVMDNTLCWIENNCPNSIQLSTNNLPSSSLCQGQTINVSFSSPNTFNAGNIFTAELSTASGTFPGTTIGTFAATTAGLPIPATIPTGATPSTNYRIRVKSSSPSKIGDSTVATFEIKAALAQPSTISGPSSVCTGQTGVVYSVINDPSASFYTWALPSGATGSSLTNSITVNMNTATSGSISVTASNGTCASPPRTQSLTFGTTNTWLGVNSNWFDVVNWSCGYVPNALTNVQIPSVSICPIISSGSATCNNLTVLDSLTIDGGTLTIKGTLQVSSGARFLGNSGTVSFSGTSSQSLTGSGQFLFNNLTVGSQGVEVTGPDSVKVAGVLTLNGKMVIGTKNLIMECGATVSGASVSNYILSSHSVGSSGFVIAKYCATGSKTFPVGVRSGSNDYYNPVIINVTAGAPTAIRVRVFDGLYEYGMAGSQILSGGLRRTWEIAPVYGTPTANMRFNWNHSTDALVNFTLPNFVRIRRNAHTGASPWVDLTTSNYTDEGSGRHSVEAIGVSTFSNFTAFAGAAVLPVDLLEFSGANVNGSAILRWRTTNELNNKGFYIEKSENGVADFASIGFVAGTQHSSGVQTYTFVDKDFDADAYYRLRMEGENGTVTYSRNVVFIGATATAKQAEFVVFPNPTEGKVTIEYTSRLVAEAKVKLDVASATGTKVLSTAGSLSEVNQHLNGIIENLSSGVYIIRIEYGTTVQHIKLMKE